ncbi:DNA polymerase III subunit delta' [Buchnera aphidicola (Muscaphis stroyani)]|uniref:DNA polymerase III subunit delta' n=1 Tax=Buchnera aphidicola (Muscaphis stroyani) TaxID=1241869 RepID=A0A4D6YFJ9_9GAMM|nr:DNA polymerase III subunit delta' C-terminal domain-containing protein [Buchnera aphidicola]QCI24420.1 DNA polymerase III subunit delta' [Buchnera aphidicola (Muscaphis stroyani)]
MKLYPWLKEPYKNIIHQHITKKAHHSVLIKTQKGIGVFRLIWFISKWLLCLKPNTIYFCNNCHGCNLMSAQNHPDWHYLSHKKNDKIEIDCIRKINDKIFKSSQQNQNKVIIITNTQKLTESATNAFLKTLEEPPKNTWFFLVNYNSKNLYSTLNSRCLIYNLFAPLEKNSLFWLKEQALQKSESHLIALRLNQGSPVSAKKFIHGDIWKNRICFFKDLLNSVKNKNLLNILPKFYKKNFINKIDWICLLLFDAIKYNLNIKNYLINFDQMELIIFFSRYAYKILDYSIHIWIKCKYRLLKIPSINHQLLLIEQLIKWENTLNFN